MVIDLKSYKKYPRKFVLERKKYSCLTDDVVLGRDLFILFKENMVNYSKCLNSYDFSQVLYNIKNNGFDNSLDDFESLLFYDRYLEYFRSCIDIGSVVTLSFKDDNYAIYYVVDKREDVFLGIRLCYDYLTGFYVKSLNEECISYYSNFDSIMHFDNTNDRIKKLINNARNK